MSDETDDGGAGSIIEKYERLTTESIASEIMTAALSIRYERIGRVRPLLPLLPSPLEIHFPLFFPPSRHALNPSYLRTPNSCVDVCMQPENLQWTSWISGQMSKIHRLIPALQSRALPDPTVEILGIEGVAAAVALWYIDKRAPDSNWRSLQGGKELEEVSFFA